MEENPKFCGKCGASLDNSNNFCTKCGDPIKKEKNLLEKPRKKSGKSAEETLKIVFDIEGKKIEIEEKKDVAQKIAKIMADVGTIQHELGENVLWKAEKKEGFLGKKLTLYGITNYRIIYGSAEKQIQFPLKYIDIVVMNSHRAMARTGIGGFTALGRGIGIGAMQSTGKSVNVGDVNFLFQGDILITIPNVIDPAGLKNLVTQVKKQMF